VRRIFKAIITKYFENMQK